MSISYKYIQNSINLTQYIDHCKNTNTTFIPLTFNIDNTVTSFVEFPQGILVKSVSCITTTQTNSREKNVAKKTVTKKPISKKQTCRLAIKCNNKHCTLNHPPNWNPPCIYARTNKFCTKCGK